MLVAALLLGMVRAQSEAAYPVLTTGDGSAVAWLYRDDDLILAVGEAEVFDANSALARRAAVLDAQRHVIRATALLRGPTGGRLVGVIRNGRVVLIETEARRVRVYYVARLTDIEVR